MKTTQILNKEGVINLSNEFLFNSQAMPEVEPERRVKPPKHDPEQEPVRVPMPVRIPKPATPQIDPEPNPTQKPVTPVVPRPMTPYCPRM